MRDFSFRPVTTADFPLLHDWLNRKHVADRWDGPMSFEEVREELSEMIESQKVFPHIVYLEGRPIGYIQSYTAFGAGGGWWPDEPEGTWGVDQFIAEESLLGMGIGSEFVRLFTNQLLDDPRITRLITDPSPDNPRAIRAYEKAGFKAHGEIETPDGPALLMEKLAKT